MSFMDRLFSFEGRLRRRDWWLLGIGLGVINYVITQVVAPMVLGADGRPQITPGSFMPIYPVPLLAIMLGMSALMIWPSLAMAVKRAHDRNTSGKLFIVLTVVNIFLSWPAIVLGSINGEMPMGLFWASTAIGAVIGLYCLVVLGFLDGTQGPNNYGPSPKGVAGQAAAVANEFS